MIDRRVLQYGNPEIEMKRSGQAGSSLIGLSVNALKNKISNYGQQLTMPDYESVHPQARY